MIVSEILESGLHQKAHQLFRSLESHANIVFLSRKTGEIKNGS
jgi:hypothetical protein